MLRLIGTIGLAPGVVVVRVGGQRLAQWTISLGNQQIGASDRPDLDIRCTASDRDGPCDTRVNGPPMARGVVLPEGADYQVTHASLRQARHWNLPLGTYVIEPCLWSRCTWPPPQRFARAHSRIRC